MNRKQVISVIAVILAMLLLVAGCGQSGTQANGTQGNTTAQTGGSGGNSGSQGEVVNIKYAYIGDAPTDEAEVMKAVNEKLAKDGVGVSVECVYIPDSEYVNKIAMIAAAKDDYDICWTMPTNISQLVSKGGLAPLAKSLDANGKNLLDAVTKTQWKEVTFAGDIYGIPGLLAAASVDMNIQIRTDYMKKYGLDKIETVDDLEKYALAYQKDHPDGVAFYNMSGRELYREYGQIFEPIGKELKSPVCIVLDDPTMAVQNFYKTDTFLKTINKIREWDSKGLFFLRKAGKKYDTEISPGFDWRIVVYIEYTRTSWHLRG